MVSVPLRGVNCIANYVVLYQMLCLFPSPYGDCRTVTYSLNMVFRWGFSSPYGDCRTVTWHIHYAISSSFSSPYGDCRTVTLITMLIFRTMFSSPYGDCRTVTLNYVCSRRNEAFSCGTALFILQHSLKTGKLRIMFFRMRCRRRLPCCLTAFRGCSRCSCRRRRRPTDRRQSSTR